MRNFFKWDRKYLYWGITAFCVVACAILFYMALNYLPVLGLAFSAAIKILSPFVWGLIICYLLSPLMRVMERTLFMPLATRLYRKNKKHDGKTFARGMSVLVSEVLMIAIIAALVYLIIPQIYSSLETIVATSPQYIARAAAWITSVLEDFPEIEQYAMQTLGDVNQSFVSWIQSTVLPELGSLVSNLTAGVYYVLIGVYNLVIGIIVSIYILGNLEKFKANSVRMLYSVFSVDNSKKILEGMTFINKTFMSFITGKLLDSAIVGMICYTVCAILRMPYALLVSVIIGVTNVIPFFGPFIGAIPSTLIILLADPIKGLIFLTFVIILQQVDGNIIGPKILGSSTGINGFWVMFAIILGAGLFGFWGMLLGVPVFVVIYTLINNLIEKKLKKSGLPWETADYVDMDYIDPITREIIKKVPPDDDDAQE